MAYAHWEAGFKMQHSPDLIQPQKTCLAVAEAWRNAVEAARWSKNHVLKDMVPEYEVFKKVNCNTTHKKWQNQHPKRPCDHVFPLIAWTYVEISSYAEYCCWFLSN